MKIGIIGTSFILASILPQMKRAGMELGAVCSRREETGRALAAEHGIPAVYTQLEEMLADPALDWIYVCTPNSLHYPQAKAALAAGKNVLCEKPMVPTEGQALRDGGHRLPPELPAHPPPAARAGGHQGGPVLVLPVFQPVPGPFGRAKPQRL